MFSGSLGATTGRLAAPAREANRILSRDFVSRINYRPVIVATRNGFKPSGGSRSANRNSTVAKAAAAAAPASSARRQAPAKQSWWTRDSAENMIDVNSVEELTKALSNAGDRLVIVDFYAQWCNSCRALYPKLCKMCRENQDILFIKVNWENNKGLCKALGIKVLPYFQFYRGAEGKLDAFSASISKFKRLKDALEKHNTPRCSLGPPPPLQLAAAEKREIKSTAKLVMDSVVWDKPRLSPAV